MNAPPLRRLYAAGGHAPPPSRLEKQIHDQVRAVVRALVLAGVEVDPDIVLRSCNLEFHRNRDGLVGWTRHLAETAQARGNGAQL